MYAGEPAPAVPPRPQEPPRPAGPPSGGSDGGTSGGSSGSPVAFLPPPTRSGRDQGRDRGRDRGADRGADQGRGADRAGGSPWTAKPVEDAPADPEALPPAYRAVSTGDWDYVTIDFGDGPLASNRPIPEQRTAADAGSAPGAGGDAAEGDPAAPDAGDAAPTEGGAAGKGGRKGRAKGSGKEPAGKRTGGKKAPARGKNGPAGAGPAGGAPAAKGGPAKAPGGRRPSLLLLLSAAVLVGGAVTGQLIAMLIGWALGYLSRQLSDFTRKLAVFGIPLMVISGSSLFYWGRAQGRWGVAPPPGEQGSHTMWEAAPGVLRVAAVLSAVFLLLMSLRRKGGGAAGAGQ
ncbi:hypothetical protein [Kitasatospora purpeofusca]|uniref:hypothetical protein n=1 Tax=Kitasatospora purpeofusca TaxID=67352 RepID=UPI002A59ABFA|nr:hypothetical protein [Kitasatospora purpeofusca]MDY0811955.1 hypothetical protein [Kitasatospora purpeofusca]